MIGGNCAKALEPCSVISSENNGPCAIRRRLGWCIVGPMDANSSQIGCNFIGNAGYSSGSSSHSSSLKYTYNDISDNAIHTCPEKCIMSNLLKIEAKRKLLG